MKQQSLFLAITFVTVFLLAIFPDRTFAQSPQACLPLDARYPDSRHVVRAELDYDKKSLHVIQQVDYANRTGEILSHLVFNVEANQAVDGFVLDSVMLGREALAFELDGKRLTVFFPDDQPLSIDCYYRLTLDYVLNVPQYYTIAYGQRGFFASTPRQMNLGGWLATVANYHAGGWVTREPSRIGEQDVLAIADWEVHLSLVAPNDRIKIAGAGIGGQITPNEWRFTHHGAREITLSISDQFFMEHVPLEDGATVELYTFNTTGAVAQQKFRDVTVQSLELFQELFSPYPNERLVMVQGDFPDGMEFDGLTFVGDSWFTNWNGRDSSYLTLITVHEVAHQWWYARVGNDSALTPWLDEALSTYSEYLYLERYHPDLLDWWWGFRVDTYAPQGFVDGTVYEFATAREYINAVYLRGVRMLHDLRQDLGDAGFFALLQDYARIYDGVIATPDDFWALLTPEQLEQTSATRGRYLRVDPVNDGD
jgi:hypothetical protein